MSVNYLAVEVEEIHVNSFQENNKLSNANVSTNM